MNKASRIVLFIVGVLCLVPFFYPTFRHTNIPNGKEDRFTLGLPMSPWLVSISKEISEKTSSEDGLNSSFNMSLSQNRSVQLFSWSWIFLIVGVTIMSKACQKRATVAPENG